MATKLTSVRSLRAPMIAGLTVAAALIPFSNAASADNSSSTAARRAEQLSPPIKDCTRLNGHYGYYGNPWCTEAEQLLFDRWSARNQVASDKR